MKMNRDGFVFAGIKALEAVYDHLSALGNLPLKSLEPQKTVLVVVDMVNGFVRDGALYSPRVEQLVHRVEELSKACGSLGIEKLAFADAHSVDSPEFRSYPRHCVDGSEESELIAELKVLGGFQLIKKNSTNGFLEPEFQEWLSRNPQVENFIVIGDCTDICIQQFSVTLKCSFNRVNRNVRVIVPASHVDTYDVGIHGGELMHSVALIMMADSGVEVVGRVDYE